MYLPGTRIPIDEPEQIFEATPDYVLILPWNIKDEIMEQMSRIARVGRPLRRRDPDAARPRMSSPPC